MIRKGDLLFVYSNSIIGEIIEHVTHGASHVAMFISEDKLVEAQGGRTFGECDLSFYLDSDDYDKVEVWTDKTLTTKQRDEMVDYSKSLYGEKYDYKLVPLEFLQSELGIDLDWYHEGNEKICSTAAASIARYVGVSWSEKKNPSPADLQAGGKLNRSMILKSEEA